MADHDGVYIHLAKARADKGPATMLGLIFGFAIICTVIDPPGSSESIISPSPIMIVMGSTSISNRAAPRQMEMPLNILSPPNKLVRYFD